MLSKEYAVVGEDVIVTKLDCPMYNRLGQIWKVRTNGERVRVSISFNEEIYSFNLEDLTLA